ncbi:MAG: TonB C-terminal domain-containing protein [Sulfurimonas sp.]
MARNNRLFYLSGLIAVSLFSLFLVMFFYMLFSSSKINSFALKKDNYISISLDVSKTNSKHQKRSIAPNKVASQAPKMSKNVDINDLFSDVWTKKIIPTKEKPKNSKRIQEIRKKISTSKENNRQQYKEKTNNSENIKSNEESSPSSTANEVNEYLAKIQALVYKYFNVPANSEGHSVKALIELNALGKVLDFRVLTYSDNEALNEEVDKIKERLVSVVFPINKQNKSTRTIVILTSKE